jgi:hypothetical protein
MAHTQVLLREDIDNLGARGEIVRVKPATRATTCCRGTWQLKRPRTTCAKSKAKKLRWQARSERTRDR